MRGQLRPGECASAETEVECLADTGHRLTAAGAFTAPPQAWYRMSRPLLDFCPPRAFGGLNPPQTPTLRRYLVDATINGVGFLEPFLAPSWAFLVPLHTREVAGSKPAAPIHTFSPANRSIFTPTSDREDCLRFVVRWAKLWAKSPEMRPATPPFRRIYVGPFSRAPASGGQAQSPPMR